MVCRTPYPWYIKHPAYGISKAHTHGILNPLLMALWTCSFGKNGGGSIYHDGVQNTMMEIWPWDQNTTWYIDLIWFIVFNATFMVYWTRGQNTIWYFEPRINFVGVQNTIWHPYRFYFPLKVYDGDSHKAVVLMDLKGTMPVKNTVESSTNKMMLYFYSDSSMSYLGFKSYYTSTIKGM